MYLTCGPIQQLEELHVRVIASTNVPPAPAPAPLPASSTSPTRSPALEVVTASIGTNTTSYLGAMSVAVGTDVVVPLPLNLVASVAAGSDLPALEVPTQSSTGIGTDAPLQATTGSNTETSGDTELVQETANLREQLSAAEERCRVLESEISKLQSAGNKIVEEVRPVFSFLQTEKSVQRFIFIF